MYNVNSGVLTGKHLLPFFRLSTEDGTPHTSPSPSVQRKAALLPGRFPLGITYLTPVTTGKGEKQWNEYERSSV